MWKYVARIDSLKEELIHDKQFQTAEQMYLYYKVAQRDVTLEKAIWMDCTRTDPKNKLFQVDYTSGKNPLFNVLMAYANFDPEVNYCQGMNFVVSWLLRYT